MLGVICGAQPCRLQPGSLDVEEGDTQIREGHHWPAGHEQPREWQDREASVAVPWPMTLPLFLGFGEGGHLPLSFMLAALSRCT